MMILLAADKQFLPLVAGIHAFAVSQASAIKDNVWNVRSSPKAGTRVV